MLDDYSKQEKKTTKSKQKNSSLDMSKNRIKSAIWVWAGKKHITLGLVKATFILQMNNLHIWFELSYQCNNLNKFP